MGLYNIDVIREAVKLCEILRIIDKEDGKEKMIKKMMPILEVNDVLKHMIDEGFLASNYIPTGKGRELIKVGLTGGVFDIVHIGHIRTLEEAKKYVDLLAVVVARDSTVKALKNREPLNTEGIRLEIVSNLKPVDVAILGDEKDFMIPVRKIRPDIIFLGYDQELPPPLKGRIKNIEIRKLNVYYKGYKSSLMIKKLLNMLGY